jgi:ankyrin repeat protein
MKRYFLLLIALFALSYAKAQTITLRNISNKYYNVKNIKYTCEGDGHFRSIYYTELQKFYKINQPDVEPDVEIKILDNIYIRTTQTRAKKVIHIDNLNGADFYRTIKALYFHSQILEFKIIIDDEVFPKSGDWCVVPLGSKENKESSVSSYFLLPGYDNNLIAEAFRKTCPLIYTTKTYNCNDTKLLEEISEFNIDDILIQGQNINGLFGENHITMLMYAIENDKTALFEKLLQHKPNLEQKDKNGWTAFMYAKIFVRENMAKKLAAMGAETTLTDNTGKNIEELAISLNAKSLMMAAIQNKDIAMIKNLLAKGVKITENNDDKATYLKTAILTDNIELIKFLTDQGILLNTMFNNNKESVSDVAASNHCFVALNYFIEKNIPFQSLKYNFEWLPFAYKDNFKEIILIMLSTNKADVESFTSLLDEIINMKDYIFMDKITALPQKQMFNLEKLGNSFALLEPKQLEKYLVGFDFEPIKLHHTYRYLINKSLDKGNMKLYYWYLSDSGFKLLTKYNTPAEIALLQKNCEQMKCIDPDPVICMESFKKWPQYIHKLDLLGVIPLDYFIEKGYDDMVEYLVNNGADINRMTTVLRKHDKIFEELNCPAYSVLDLAYKYGNEDVIDILLKKGAKSWKSNKHNLVLEAYMGNYDSLLTLVNFHKLPDFVATDSVILKSKWSKEKVIVPGQSLYLLLRENAYDQKVQKILIKLFDYGYKLEDKPEDPILNKVFNGFPDYDLVSRFIKEGAIVDHPYYVENGYKSPLFLVSAYGHWENDKILELLLKNGAKLDTKLKDSKENTIRKKIQKEAKYFDFDNVIELLKKY